MNHHMPQAVTTAQHTHGHYRRNGKSWWKKRREKALLASYVYFDTRELPGDALVNISSE